MMFFADIIVPVPLKHTYTYALNLEQYENAKVGSRVVVKFSNSIYTGIVNAVHQNEPEQFKALPIIQLIDSKPIITQKQIDLWKWIANYYNCALGEVFKNAVPSALKLEGETIITKSPFYTNLGTKNLTDDEFLIWEALQNSSSLKVDEIQEITEKKTTVGLLKSLYLKGVISLEEDIKYTYKPKVISYVEASEKLKEKSLESILVELKRSSKQKELVLTFLEVQEGKAKITKKEILEKANATNSSFKGLLEKNILKEIKEEVDRIQPLDHSRNPIKILNKPQEKALEKIQDYFKAQKTVLLHGITSSGKTEVYTHLIQEQLNQNKQVIYLLPEIALTTQLINRLRAYFGDSVGVYHSRFNKNERAEIWNKTLDGTYKILIGARSTIYLPYTNLGLVIIDEEHENSFKQYRPTPHYHARDTAIVLAQQFKASVLLGSATPSLESYYNAIKNKYGYVTLNQRYKGVSLPDIQIVDMAKEQKEKTIQGHFSSILLKAIKEALENKKQIILFKNRRGFAPILECLSCGYTPQCPNCDVSLTFHAFRNQLRCHYCSHSISVPSKCHSCNSQKITTKGYGTEQIELEIQSYFPEANVKRMDLDTTRKKNSYFNIISDFEQQEIDILIGTQMITKGLHFENVSLVGVLSADQQLNMPDFRAHEKTFQLITQVSGRAGRKDTQGKVLIQAYQPNHKILQQISTHSYLEMAKEQLYERKHFNYPPFYRIIQLTLKHPKKEVVKNGAVQLVQALKIQFKEQILGPEEPGINRIRNLYLQNILIKLDNSKSIQQQKIYINKVLANFKKINKYKSIHVVFDVDPL